HEMHIDIETYSYVDIRYGAFRYAEGMELLLIAYAYDDEPVRIIDVHAVTKELAEDRDRYDLTLLDVLPKDFTAGLLDPSIMKYAHNAAFERSQLGAALHIYL